MPLYGHALLAQTLLEQGLLDEFKLWIHPLCVGHVELLLRESDKGG